MKVLNILLFLFFISFSLNANEKWISLDATQTKASPKKSVSYLEKQDKDIQVDITQIKPVKNMLDRIKIAKYFLDKKPQVKKSKEQKNWFKLKTLKQQ